MTATTGFVHLEVHIAMLPVVGSAMVRSPER